jgi:hypothetical protein
MKISCEKDKFSQKKEVKEINHFMHEYAHNKVLPFYSEGILNKKKN